LLARFFWDAFFPSSMIYDRLSSISTRIFSATGILL
jgi:hypothetical protein